jgi:hypothetical protein
MPANLRGAVAFAIMPPQGHPGKPSEGFAKIVLII